MPITGVILIVDDSEDNVVYMSQILRHYGYEYAVARNGDEALDVMRESPPVLVLLDIMMPKKSGIGVLKQMKEEPLLRDIPVLIVSGATMVTGVDIPTGEESPRSSHHDDFSRSFGTLISDTLHGVEPDGYVDKPVHPQTLIAKIKELLNDGSWEALHPQEVKMPETRAQEIMIPIEEYPWVGPDKSVREAMLLLDAPRFDIVASSGRLSVPWVLLVIDEGGALVGMLRRRDILRGLGPWYARGGKQDVNASVFPVPFDPNLAELSRPAIAKAFRDRARQPVRDLMLPVKVAIDVEDDLEKIIEIFVAHDTSVLPVLDSGKVVGVISSVDVFYEVTRIVLSEQELREGEIEDSDTR